MSLEIKNSLTKNEEYAEEVDEEKEKPIIKPPPKRPRSLQPEQNQAEKSPKEGEEEEEEEGGGGGEEGDDDEVFIEMTFSGCTSEELLNKRTTSFTCFEQVVLSSSSLLRNLNYVFPPLKDPGIDDAFNYVEPVPVYDDIGVEKYEYLCKQFEIVPLSRIKATLGTKLINLKFYGLREKQLKAIMETLKGNHYVERLILQDNFLTTEMTQMVCYMIEENATIRSLSLQQCNIGPEGAVFLSDSLSTSQFLAELNLSFNNIEDKGMKCLEQGLCDMPSLVILDIGNNKLTEESADVVEKIITENKSLSELSLAWNGFYTSGGNKLIARALKNTDRLRVLNLSWNGISQKPAITQLCRYIRKSEVLEELDLSWNRFEEEAINAVRRAILNNCSLITVKLGSIPCTPEKAGFVAGILVNKNKIAHPIKLLDMENIYFNKDIKKVSKHFFKSVPDCSY